MKALLDTHAFLWAITDDARLSPRARDLLRDSTTELLLSPVTAWEIAVKSGLGKLRISTDPIAFVPRHMRALCARPLPVQIEHALQVGRLPMLHKDPFDRFLVAQAQVEGIPILTADRQMARYPVDVVW
jgi:PIN domain nuclease of toxin-antitoxin system